LSREPTKEEPKTDRQEAKEVVEGKKVVTPEEDAKVQKIMVAVKALCAMKMQKTDGVPAEIIPNLFLGGIGVASSKKNLEAAGITHILTVANKLQPPYPNVSPFSLNF
jgi:hypothetical protein